MSARVLAWFPRASRSALEDPVARATLLLICGGLLGRTLGFVREMLLARKFGLGEDLDTLIAALALGDVLTFLLIGAATSAAIVPFLARVLVIEKEGERFAIVARSLLNWALVLFCALALVGAWWADAAIAMLAPGLSVAAAEAAAGLTRVAMLGVVFTGLTLVQVPTLQARQRFGMTALATAIYNGAVVVGLVVAWRTLTPAAVIWITIGATALRWGAHDAALRVLGVHWRPLVGDWQWPAARAVLVALPAALAVSLADIGILVDRHFASQLAPGTLATVSLADKLVALPLGMLAGSIATAALPSLAASAHRPAEFFAMATRAVRRAVGLTGAAAAVLYLLAHPVVALAYGGGAFDAGQIARTSSALSTYALALPCFAASLVLARVAFARSTFWIAGVAVLAGLGVRALLQYWVIVGGQGDATAIAWGAVLGAGAQLLVLGVWYWRVWSAWRTTLATR